MFQAINKKSAPKTQLALIPFGLASRCKCIRRGLFTSGSVCGLAQRTPRNSGNFFKMCDWHLNNQLQHVGTLGNHSVQVQEPV